MNLTRIIEETGKRVRLGKIPADRLTNAEVKTVLETAIEVLREGLIQEGRVEIQDFAVLELRTQTIRPSGVLQPVGQGRQPLLTTTRQRWLFRPSRPLRAAARPGSPRTTGT
jgi:nucleoid DNA-binding protein